MKSTVYEFTVEGDNYEELVSAADSGIARFFSSAVDEDFEDENGADAVPSSARVDYELKVSASGDIASDYEYTAHVLVKIRDR